MTPAQSRDTDPSAAVAAALTSGGLPAALAALNALTPFRYTALYRFDGTYLRNRHFYDRRDPAAVAGDDLPITATSCVSVQHTGRPFVLADALADIRAEGHPEQKEIRAYCGVAVHDAAGRVVGSLCHFDHLPVADPGASVALTEAVARLVGAARLS